MVRSSRLKVCLAMVMRNSSQIHCARLVPAKAGIDQPPANDAVHRRDRAVLDDRHQGLTLRIIQLRWLAWSLAVDEPIRPPGIEPQRPVANGLQANAANPGGITASAAIVNLRQRQKPARMPAISRPSGKTT